MKFSQAVAFVAMALGIGTAPKPAIAAPEWSCVEPILAQELQAKLDFQDTWAQSISTAQPDLTEFAELVAAATKLNFQVSRAKVLWLWQTDQDAFDHRDAFFSYGWDDEDASKWLAASAENTESQRSLDALKEQLEAHPGAENYQNFLGANLRESPFLELAEEFGAQNKAIRDKLDGCF